MRKLTTEERTILHNHEKWLNGRKAGAMANFNMADLSGADLHTVNLCKARLRNTNLVGADLREADLRDADLSGADLKKATLKKVDLVGADLSEADLYSANLSEANLARADLRKANLTRACLYRADLTGADLYGADLTGAILTGANLSDVRNVLDFGPIGSRHKSTYAIRHAECVMVKCGCFWGPLEEWEAKCRSVHRDPAQPHGTVYGEAANFIRSYSLYWGREEAQEVGAAKRWAEQKVVWLTDKLAYTCQCSRDTSCGIPGPCPLNIGVNCLDVEPADWANLAGKRWEE